MKSVEDELCPKSIFHDDFGYVYTFSQVYKGLPVFGSTVSVSTDLQGNTNGLNSYYVPFELNTTPALTCLAAMSSSTINYIRIISAELNVYIDNGIPRLAWNVEFFGWNRNVGSALIDAINAEILYESTGFVY